MKSVYVWTYNLETGELSKRKTQAFKLSNRYITIIFFNRPMPIDSEWATLINPPICHVWSFENDDVKAAKFIKEDILRYCAVNIHNSKTIIEKLAKQAERALKCL